MNILSVETTCGDCSVALLKNDVIISSQIQQESGKQAEQMISIIESVLKNADCTYDDLNAIAANVGPGSFTGVRIGLSGVKGINLVKKTPLIAVSSFESVAKQLPEDSNKNILVVLDAKREQVYAQLLSHDLRALSTPELLYFNDITTIAKNEDFILTGNGSILVSEILKEAGFNFILENQDTKPEAKSIALVANEKLKKNDYSDNIFPLYIRQPDAK
jgi:tRNA threonylcarbamoyladenosine biosynthesis protein TsaB